MSHEEFAKFLNRKAREAGSTFNMIVSGLSQDLGHVIEEIDRLNEQKLVPPDKRFPVNDDRGFTLSGVRDHCSGYVSILGRILKSQANPEDASRLKNLDNFTSELQEIGDAVERDVLAVQEPTNLGQRCGRIIEGAFAVAEIQIAFEAAFEAGRKSVFAEMQEAYQERQQRTGRAGTPGR